MDLLNEKKISEEKSSNIINNIEENIKNNILSDESVKNSLKDCEKNDLLTLIDKLQMVNDEQINEINDLNNQLKE